MTKSFHEITSKDFDNVAVPVTVKYPHNAESRNLKTFQDSYGLRWVPVIGSRISPELAEQRRQCTDIKWGHESMQSGWYVQYYPVTSLMVRSFGAIN